MIFAPTTRPPSTHRAWWHTRPFALWFAGAALALCSTPALADVVLEEAHTIVTEQLNPDFDSTYLVSYDLPRFDIQGGARTLLGFREAYELRGEGVITVADNPSPTETVSSQVRWGVSWHGEVAGQPFFPLHDDFTTGVVQFLKASGASVGPLGQGWTRPTSGGVQVERLITDQAAMETLTGSSPVDVDGIFQLDPLTVEPADPFSTWDPDLVSLTLTRVSMEHTVTYLYQEVPEPASCTLLALASVGALLNRRRPERRG